MNANHDSDDIRDRVKLTYAEQLYQIKDENGQLIDFEQANGRQLFNHYRHNMTNYDQVLNGVRAEQGHVTGRQEKKAAVGAASRYLRNIVMSMSRLSRIIKRRANYLRLLCKRLGLVQHMPY